MKNKTPFLSGFPHTLFGSAGRGAQQKIVQQRRKLIDLSPGSLSAELSNVLDPQFVSESSGEQRRRHFTHEVTFWSFLGQVLSDDRSCRRAVAEAQSWFVDHQLPLPSADTSSYCQARQRLPKEMLDRIHQQLNQTLLRETSSELFWHGHHVKAFDGSSVQ